MSYLADPLGIDNQSSVLKMLVSPLLGHLILTDPCAMFSRTSYVLETMKTIAVLLLLTLGAIEGRAQLYFSPTTEPVFVGDTAVIGTLSSYQGQHCKFSLYLLEDPYRLNFFYRDSEVWCIPTRPGFFRDTATVHVSYFTSRCGLSGSQNVVAYGRVLSDSVVRIRPRRWTAIIEPDTLAGGWLGRSVQKLHNNLPYIAKFSGWKLIVHPDLQATLEVLHNGERIDTLLAQPFEKNIEVQYVIRAKRGPIFYPAVREAVISVRVKNGLDDSVYTSNVTLDLRVPAWKPDAGFVEDTIYASSPVGETIVANVGLKADAQTEQYTIEALRGVFQFDPPVIEPGTLNELQIRCSAQTPGKYVERLSYTYAIRDHNGDLRQDSTQALLVYSAEGPSIPPEWEGTDGSVVTARHLAFGPDGALYAADRKIFRTTTQGARWEELPSVDSQIFRLAINPANDLYVINQAKRVRRTRPPEFEWDSVSIIFEGPTRYQPDTPYDIDKLLLVDTLILVHGTCNYYDMWDHVTVWEELSGMSTDGGRYWSSYNFNGFSDIDGVSFDSTSTQLTWQGSQLTPAGTNVYMGFDGPIKDVAVSGNGDWFVLTTRGLFRTQDRGNSWRRCSLVFDSITGFGATPDDQLYLATLNDGVYRSKDGGVTWSSITSGIGSKRIFQMVLRAGDHVYVGTLGGGVYRTTTRVVSAPLQVDAQVITEGNRLGAVVEHSLTEVVLRLEHSGTEVRAADMLGRPLTYERSGDRVRIRRTATGPILIRLDYTTRRQVFKIH